MNPNYHYDQYGFLIAILIVTLQNYYFTAKKGVGWEITQTQTNNCWSAVISIHLLLQIANKKLLQSKFQLSGFQDGAGYWACGNDFFKASSQWVFLFPRDLAHCGESCQLQWEAALPKGTLKREAPLTSVSRGQVWDRKVKHEDIDQPG